MAKKHSIGWIPFWNLHPFKQELVRKMGDDFALFTGKPTAVNKALNKSEVQIAPSSSICLLTNQDSRIALPLGVVAEGKVRSVYWGIHHDSRKTLEHITTKTQQLRLLFAQAKAAKGSDLRGVTEYFWKHLHRIQSTWEGAPPTIHLTNASATSAMLSKILYKMYFGKDAFQETFGKMAIIKSQFRDSSDMSLVIGDEALFLKKKFACEIDLSEIWHSIMDLPFVFAVWQAATTKIDPQLSECIKGAAAIAEKTMRIQPSTYLPQTLPLDWRGVPIDLNQYWGLLRYQLTTNDRMGLLLFLNFARPLLPEILEASSLSKLARWQNQVLDLVH